MASATITKYLDTKIPSMEAVMLSASDTNTYKSRKFRVVTAAIAQYNVDTDDTISVCNSDNTSLDGTDQTVRINSSSASSSAILLLLWGDQ